MVSISSTLSPALLFALPTGHARSSVGGVRAKAAAAVAAARVRARAHASPHRTESVFACVRIGKFRLKHGASHLLAKLQRRRLHSHTYSKRTTRIDLLRSKMMEFTLKTPLKFGLATFSST
eukprot:2676812-Pleurochrysis_carterae.AAC.2